jgi:hypothetical protein
MSAASTWKGTVSNAGSTRSRKKPKANDNDGLSAHLPDMRERVLGRIRLAVHQTGEGNQAENLLLFMEVCQNLRRNGGETG